MKRRSLKQDKLARVYDTEILPIWAERFGRLLLAEAKVRSNAMVLNVACGTGYPALELLDMMDGGRIIALVGENLAQVRGQARVSALRHRVTPEALAICPCVISKRSRAPQSNHDEHRGQKSGARRMSPGLYQERAGAHLKVKLGQGWRTGQVDGGFTGTGFYAQAG